MRRRGFLMSVLLSTLLASEGCSAKDNVPDYRVRVEVEVETLQGLHVGSSILEVRQSLGSSAGSGFKGQIFRRVRGEAVAVDLPGEKTLFALVPTHGWLGRTMHRLAPNVEGEPWEERFDNVLMLEGKGEIELPKEWPTRNGEAIYAYPMFVTFRDEGVPETVEQVDPTNLSQAFGAGVKLKRITLQLTDEPVSSEILDRLPWLPQYYDRMLDGRSTRSLSATNQVANKFSQNNFIVGLPR